MHLQTIQPKITPIAVPIYELPEYMCVDNIIITQQYALDNNITNVPTISRSFASKSQDGSNVDSPGDRADRTTETSNENSTQTGASDTRIPSREREIQTEIKTYVDVATQCKRDDEWEWEFEKSKTNTTDSNQKDDQTFRAYVGENTNMYPNGMLECSVCGEMSSFLLEHQSHMALHFGPPALCSACGKMVGHKRLLPKHRFSCLARPNAKVRPVIHMQCPHIHCSVMLNSKRELAKHIKIHPRVDSYYCMQCQQIFSSYVNFLGHRQTKPACIKAKHIYLTKNSPTLNTNADLNRCTTCMKQFYNSDNCKWHKIRCIRAHKKRLKNLFKRCHVREVGDPREV